VRHRDVLDMVCPRSFLKPVEARYEVRRLGVDDVDVFLRFKEAQGSSMNPGEALIRLASPHWHYYGAFVNGELAAIGTTYLKLPEVWVIGDVFTLPRFRGLGLAKSVVHALTRDALASGAIPMLHVLEDNLPAIKAYRRVGYRAVRLRERIMLTK
jgi:predicted GNAT family acetyltransferase